MNIYKRKFIATCPNNGEHISYELTIETNVKIMVEHIVAATKMIKSGYHEDIADNLLKTFGGKQVLKAHHHEVDIETIRTAP